MARNSTLQVLRGTQGGIQNAMPLALGEMYFATDTGNLFFGTPGYGLGYVQIGDTTDMNETLLRLLAEIRSMRQAIIQIACDGGKCRPQDFDINVDETVPVQEN